MLKSMLKAGGAAVAVALAVTACGGGSGGGSSSSGSSLSVAYMVPGTLGDLGFFDSGEAGIKKAESQLGVKTKTVEGGTNATATWKSDLQNLSSSGNYGLVVTGSDQVTDQITAVAKQNPKQKYVVFDQSIDLPNVASITYRQNDGAFLAGVLATLVAKDTQDFPLASGTPNVGIVGGQNIPVINDFIVGFQKGAQSVDPAVKVQTSYVGNFTDAQTGYNQAASMYASGASVVFAAAGGAGLGVLKASQAQNKYSIGVDSNQNNLYPKNVLASDLKNVGSSVFDLIKKDKTGTLGFGKTYVYGIQNGGVELALNDALVPASVKSQVSDYSQKVSSGQIDVPCVQPFCAKATS